MHELRPIDETIQELGLRRHDASILLSKGEREKARLASLGCKGAEGADVDLERQV